MGKNKGVGLDSLRFRTGCRRIHRAVGIFTCFGKFFHWAALEGGERREGCGGVVSAR